MIKIITKKKYEELLDKLSFATKKNVDLTLDKADLQANIDIYEEQVKYLLNKVSELEKELAKKSKKTCKNCKNDEEKVEKVVRKPRKTTKESK